MRQAAIYARYSTDKQSRLSLSDQVRKCREYAAAHDLVVLEQHVYLDEAVSGVGSDRRGLRSLMDAALSTDPPFDAIIVDDTSRLSRTIEETLSLVHRLKF